MMNRWILFGLLSLAFACDDGDKDDSGSDTDNGGDTDTDEEVFPDEDGDGFTADEDCDDTNPDINPDADEECDGIDNDCDNRADEGLDQVFYADVDTDGYGDDEAQIIACAPPLGHVEDNTDCDDEAADVNPGVTVDECNDVDNDCDGDVDEDAEFLTVYNDNDNDGYGTTAVLYCGDEQPDDTTALDGDCNDDNDRINPGRAEICDDLDNNCNDEIDEGVTTTYYRDRDEDGFGTTETTRDECEQPSGYVTNGDDCDDENPAWADHCYNTWTGYETFQLAERTSGAGTFNCDIYWDVTGVPTTATLCTDCEFGFDLELALDTAESEDDGTCAKEETNLFDEPFFSDLSYTYAYHPDYYGEPTIMIGYGGDWYSWQDTYTTNFSAETGTMTFGYEDAETVTDSNGRSWYYAYIQYGSAELTYAEEE